VVLKVDSVEVGTRPKAVHMGVGKHMLEFSKGGFNTGHFPLGVSPTDVSGGSVSYELGALATDTVELRDGSVLSGDLDSVSATEVARRRAAPRNTLVAIKHNASCRLSAIVPASSGSSQALVITVTP
jgi:hypothetical protein